MSHAEQTTPSSSEYSADQEAANVATHGAGFLLAVGATVYVVTLEPRTFWDFDVAAETTTGKDGKFSSGNLAA